MQTVSRPRKRRKLSPEQRAELQREALRRGRQRRPGANDVTVIRELTARGVNPDTIDTCGPDQNVFTYPAWQALGRQVRRNEHGVKLPVWIPGDDTTDPQTGEITRGRSFARTAVVFHVSQTDPISEKVVA